MFAVPCSAEDLACRTCSPERISNKDNKLELLGSDMNFKYILESHMVSRITCGRVLKYELYTASYSDEWGEIAFLQFLQNRPVNKSRKNNFKILCVAYYDQVWSFVLFNDAWSQKGHSERKPTTTIKYVILVDAVNFSADKHLNHLLFYVKDTY